MDALKGIGSFLLITLVAYLSLVFSLYILMMIGHLAELWYGVLVP